MFERGAHAHRVLLREDETTWLTPATEVALRELGFSENIELKPRSARI